MSILTPPPPRPVTTSHLGSQAIAPGGMASVEVPVRGAQLGIALRTEDVSYLRITLEPYSGTGSGRFRVGAPVDLGGADNNHAFATVWMASAPAARIIVSNPTGAPAAVVRALLVTDYPTAGIGATQEYLAQLSSGVVTEGRIGAATYHASAPLPGTGVSDYDIRDTTPHLYNLPVVSEAIFDHSIWIASSLDQPMRVWAAVLFRNITGSYAFGPTFFQGLDALTLAPGGRICLCPEIPRGFSLTEENRIVVAGNVMMAEMPLLREPVMDVLQIRLYAEELAPTTGMVYLRHIWRK